MSIGDGTCFAVGNITDLQQGTSAPYPFNPACTAAPLPTYVPQHAVVKLAETPPEVIRWALGLLTPNELASALGVKEGTLSVWRSTGGTAGEGAGPPYIKLGKQVFYRLEDLHQWVWTKYPQIKNPGSGGGGIMAGVDDADDEKQEIFPFDPHDEASPEALKPKGPWTQDTTGL